MQGLKVGDLTLTPQLLHHLVTARHIVRHGCATIGLATPVGQGCNEIDRLTQGWWGGGIRVMSFTAECCER